MRNLGEEHCKVVELRSGKILEPKKVMVEDELTEKEESQPKVEVPTTEKSKAEKSNEVNLELVDSEKLTHSFADSAPQKNKEVLIILGRPFLVMRRTLIDVQKGELTMRVQDDKVTLNVLEAMKFPNSKEECSVVEELETLVSMGNNSEEDPLENALESEPFEDEKGNQCLALMEANLRSYIQPPQFEPLELEVRESTQPKLSRTKVNLKEYQEEQLMDVLKKFKKAIGGTIVDIRDIISSFCMHKIILEEGGKGKIDR
ncbi:Transposon Ty3-I Gag-Pol polyprotein [Gossypium australe]|uniref:Transposon Ty3-I Gag-Pol polyprotein n=1 Tax=Gossypium australe TaxID=47621 RepID=A0A5B6VNI2_9ROSI|nr:Transposon Ty3-I Gag-Pol polyprotein [Gossypium australe]